MKHFVYHSNTLRCRVKPNKNGRDIELQIQKKRLLFWVNCYPWMIIRVRFWNALTGNKMISFTHRCGHVTEAWQPEALDLEKRTDQFFDEYFVSLKKAEYQKKIVYALRR